MVVEDAEMNTKADKIAGIIMGVLFLCAGIYSLFILPPHWEWYTRVLYEIAIFGSSLGCFSLAFFGAPGSRK